MSDEWIDWQVEREQIRSISPLSSKYFLHSISVVRPQNHLQQGMWCVNNSYNQLNFWYRIIYLDVPISRLPRLSSSYHSSLNTCLWSILLLCVPNNKTTQRRKDIQQGGDDSLLNDRRRRNRTTTTSFDWAAIIHRTDKAPAAQAFKHSSFSFRPRLLFCSVSFVVWRYMKYLLRLTQLDVFVVGKNKETAEKFKSGTFIRYNRKREKTKTLSALWTEKPFFHITQHIEFTPILLQINYNGNGLKGGPKDKT